nr:hypothetical protein Iba_chr04dCG14480 [Ipomoea batatas]
MELPAPSRERDPAAALHVVDVQKKRAWLGSSPDSGGESKSDGKQRREHPSPRRPPCSSHGTPAAVTRMMFSDEASVFLSLLPLGSGHYWTEQRQGWSAVTASTELGGFRRRETMAVAGGEGGSLPSSTVAEAVCRHQRCCTPPMGGKDRRWISPLPLATAAAVDRTEDDGGEVDTVDILRHS